MTSQYMTTLHNFGSVLGRPVDTSIGGSQFHGHGSWLVREVALNTINSVIGIDCIHQSTIHPL